MGKKPKLSIPQRGEEFTAEWFTEILQPQYGAAVLHVDQDVIGTGIGFVGEVYRCFLHILFSLHTFSIMNVICRTTHH